MIAITLRTNNRADFIHILDVLVSSKMITADVNNYSFSGSITEREYASLMNMLKRSIPQDFIDVLSTTDKVRFTYDLGADDRPYLITARI